MSVLKRLTPEGGSDSSFSKARSLRGNTEVKLSQGPLIEDDIFFLP
jgi:hypothetical protein